MWFRYGLRIGKTANWWDARFNFRFEFMRLRLIKIRDALADSFWFVPAIMALGALCAALSSVSIDRAIGSDWVKSIGWVWSGGGEGARSVLSVIATSVMTVVSIVFSLTVTTLAQTSSHYGPRVLRNFTSDRGVQITLGTYIATFIYCLLVLRTTRTGDGNVFVPYLSVNIGVALALISLAVLIYFIHHVAKSIQAETLIAEVGEDFQEMLPTLFPQHIGQAMDDEENISALPDEEAWQKARAIEAGAHGYLQRVDDSQLMKLAEKHDLLLKMEARPGDFVAESTPFLLALPPAKMDDKIEGALRGCFSLGRHRTPPQDALYMIQQLVEIAAHALSPGINEPFTAMTCIDWLGASLRGVAGCDLPALLRQDDKGELRIIARSLDFEELTRAAFDQIRLYGATNPDVLMRLLKIIADTAPELRRRQDREVLIQHAYLIGEDAAQIVNAHDRKRVGACLQDTLRELAQENISPNGSTPAGSSTSAQSSTR